MRSTTLSLVFGLTTMALAGPSHRRFGQHHGHHAYESGHRSVSGRPYPIGNATNITALSGSSLSTIHLTSTMTVEVTTSESENLAPTQSTDNTVAKVEPTQTSAGVEDKLLVDQASAASDGCNIVTVTYNPTTTITVDAASSNAVLLSANLLGSSGSVAPIQAASSSAAAAEAVSISATIPPSTPSSSVAKQPPTPPSSSVEMAAPVPPTSSVVVAATTSAASPPSTSEAAPVASASSSLSAPSASSSTTAASNNTTFRTKRGIIASGSGQLALVSGLTQYTKISWLGDWYSGPPTNLPSTMQFVPQNYGKQSDVDGGWTSNAKKAVAAGDKYFLSFGEPGTPNAQLYMDPQDAVNLFMQKMQPYAEQGVTIGAPGTLQNDQDFAWLTSFLDGCDKAGCSIGFLAFHWFWLATEASNFKDRFTKFAALAKGKPIWVDNFQALGTAAAQKAFLQEIVPFLEEQDNVLRYAYVPVDPGQGEGFLNDDGKTLSDLGAFYGSM